MNILPKNHPFFCFETITTDESMACYLSFKNIKVDGVSLYDVYGGKTAKQNIPLIILDTTAVGKSVVDETKANVNRAIINDFISTDIHEETINDRIRVQLFDPSWDHKINWESVIYFAHMFTKNLCFIDVKCGNQGEDFVFLISSKGHWTDEDGMEISRTHPVQIKFNRQQCLEICENVYASAGLVPANDTFKSYVFSQFTNWMHHAKNDNLIKIA